LARTPSPIGIDIISDGELFRRDDNKYGPPNAMISYFASKIPGFSGELRNKYNITPIAPEAFLPAPVVTGKLQHANLTLLDEYHFLRKHTSKKVKIAMTGPHMFAKICWDEYYNDEVELAKDLARIINKEFRLLDEAACDVIQLDEPILWFLPKDQAWGIEIINMCFEGVTHAKKALHLCQGNYNPDPKEHKGIRIFPSQFNDVLPIIKGANVDVILMACAGLENDISILKEIPQDKILGVGCINVLSHEIETPEEVASTLSKVAKYVPLERIYCNPDCGLNHLPRAIAFKKLESMVAGVNLVPQ